MQAGSESRRPPPDAPQVPTFTVEEFGWGAPDRLVLAGTFSGVEPPADVVLTVFGEDGAHRLPAIGDDGAEQLDGARLTASFAWLEAPVAFRSARLELGGALAVDLLAPDAAGDGDPLPVQVLGPPDGDAAPFVEPLRRTADAGIAADRLRLETQLLEEAEDLEEARATARETDEALQRALADLAAERERRAKDAERFREGLAMLRQSAEEALAAANDERDEARAELALVREELDATRGVRDATRERIRELLDELSDLTAGRR